MIRKYFFEPYSRWLLVLIMAFFITMFSFEFINERLWLNDFRVFYDACNALLADQQVYGKNFGLDTGFYKYAPSTLILFVPLAYLPYSLAMSIYFFLLSFSVVLLLKSITQFWFKKEKSQQLKFWFSIFLMLSVTVHLIRELHLGNTNLLLLLLCFYAFNFSIKKQSILSGLLLAIVILTKPYFGLLFFPLILFGKWRTLFSSVLFILGLMLSVFLIKGIEIGMTLHKEWIISMTKHSTYLTSAQTISSLAKTYANFEISTISSMILLVITIAVLFLLFWQSIGFTGLFKSKILNKTEERKFFVFYFLTIALVPVFLITDTEHFLFVLPMIGAVGYQIVLKRSALLLCVFGLPWFFIASYGGDLWRNEWFKIINSHGFLGLGTLIICGLATILSLSFIKGQNEKDELARIPNDTNNPQI